MNSLRVVAGTLVPIVLAAEYVPAEEYRNGAWGAPPEQSHYHVPDETRGEFSISIDVPPVSGANSTASTVSYTTSDPAWFSTDSFQESPPSQTIIIAPRLGKTGNKARAVVTGFPALPQGPRQSAFVPRLHSQPVTALNVKRFLFRRP